MRVRSLHSWPTSYHEAVAVQNRLKSRLILRGDRRKYRIIAGADISYDRGDDTLFAAVVVLRLPEMEIVEISSVTSRARFPYVPGLLSFREAPPLIEAFRRLRTRPDAAIFDGHGVAHPRGFGLASHLGVWLDLPTVGCAKSILVGDGAEPRSTRGEWSPLRLKGKKLGAILRTRAGVKPVYVSQGHRIGLPAAIRLVLECANRFRLPEPTRLADREVNRLRRARFDP
ncbi:MAG: deoxyribonuclease V [Planctomycetota bacterium]|nr:deoxyribonuclease V [Planctomycetota bacterium]